VVLLLLGNYCTACSLTTELSSSCPYVEKLLQRQFSYQPEFRNEKQLPFLSCSIFPFNLFLRQPAGDYT
jgi:hypothetical protein